MKSSTKGLWSGVVIGLVFAIIIRITCDASCSESPVYFFAGVLVLVCGFLGAVIGELLKRKTPSV